VAGRMTAPGPQATNACGIANTQPGLRIPSSARAGLRRDPLRKRQEGRP
jgi:hypothetical protein